MSDSIVLVSSDGQRIAFSPKISSFSNLVKDVVGEEQTVEDIPTKVSAEHLTKIKEYLDHHGYEKPPTIPYPLGDSNLLRYISEWDNSFVSSFSREDFQVFYDMVDYLQIQVLMELCGATIASWFKGKLLEQIQAEFGLPPFSHEIEAELKTHHAWAVDETD
jgi:hypothetical protein